MHSLLIAQANDAMQPPCATLTCRRLGGGETQVRGSHSHDSEGFSIHGDAHARWILTLLRPRCCGARLSLRTNSIAADWNVCGWSDQT